MELMAKKHLHVSASGKSPNFAKVASFQPSLNITTFSTLFILCVLILSDLLRGISALPKTLRPTFFRHPVAIHFCSLEQIPMLECLPLHQPVL